MLYFAYASNLNKRAMARRAPQAVAVGPATLAGYKLCFKRHADIIADEKGEVRGALWRITPGCLRALDAYEGDDYRQIKVNVTHDGALHEAIAYVMTPQLTLAPPALDYYREIAVGYRDWGYDEALLRRARYDTLAAGPPPVPGAAPAPRKRRSVLWDPAANMSGSVDDVLKRR